MGRRERRELYSRLTVSLIPLLQWRYRPERCGNGWKNTIKARRPSVNKLVAENPSLKPLQTDLFAEAYEEARLRAASETDQDENVSPEDCPFNIEEALSKDYFPD